MPFNSVRGLSCVTTVTSLFASKKRGSRMGTKFTSEYMPPSEIAQKTRKKSDLMAGTLQQEKSLAISTPNLSRKNWLPVRSLNSATFHFGHMLRHISKTSETHGGGISCQYSIIFLFSCIIPNVRCREPCVASRSANIFFESYMSGMFPYASSAPASAPASSNA